MAADYPGAIEHFVPRSFMFNSNDPVAIVIHKTGGDATPQAVYSTFINSGNPGRSSHYAIGQDGSIWQFVPENLGAGANGIPGPQMEAFWQPYLAKYGNLNMCTISIEHCDPSGANDTPLTPAQKQASFNLVAHLCAKYNLPASHIKPHKSIAATTCPGNYPLDELIHFVETGGEPEMLQITDVASFFKAQSDTSWKCTNGNLLIGGMLNFFRQTKSPLAMIGLPKTGEISVPGHAGVKIQIFERIVLCYDPGHTLDSPPGAGDVYALHLDSVKSPGLLQLFAFLKIQPDAPTQPEKPAANTTDAIAQLYTIATAAEAALKDLGE